MTTSGNVRDAQRAATEASILDAAWDLFARCGPDGASLRDVAARAGCTHALVARYHGAKVELVGSVASLMGTRVDRVVRHAAATADDPLLELLDAARTHHTCQQLLVRSALGDLPPRDFPGCLHVDWLMSPTSPSPPTPPTPDTTSGQDGPDQRTRLLAYGAANLLLGFVTFEEFLVAATGLGRLGTRRRDVAIAQAARHLLDLTTQASPKLARRDLAAPPALVAPAAGTAAEPVPSREALLRSAVQLFAERGPASVSVRDIARHAGVNQGLIHRHFSTKEALLAEALEHASAELFPAALAEDGFDFDAMSWLLHHAADAPRLIARTLVDDVEILSVRRQFPVLRRLMRAYERVPTGAGPGDLSDPRVAVVATAAMALGSAVWGDHVRAALGLGERDGIDAAIADLARVLVAVPLVAAPDDGAVR